MEHDSFLKRRILGGEIRPERRKGQQKHRGSQENGLAGCHCVGMHLSSSVPGRSGGSHRAVAYRKQAKSHFAEARQFEEIASKIA